MGIQSEALPVPIGHVEARGIERVPEAERNHTRIWELGTLWFSANFVLSTVITGSLAPFFGLGTADSILAILIFNALGIIPVAFFSTLGPKLGLRTMTISRFAFGWRGGQLTALFNIAAALGWSVVNTMIGASLFSDVVGWPYWLGVILIAAATSAVSIYGYKYVHGYERWAWVPLAITFLILAVVAAPHMHAVPTPTWSLAFVAGWLTYGGAILGFAIGWSSYSSDYSTYMPENVPAARVFWWTFAGEFLACVLLELFGLALTTWLPKDAGASSLLVGGAGPLGRFGSFLLLLIVASVVANNIPNDYSLALTTQVLGRWWMHVPRWALTGVGAVVYCIVAILLGANVSTTLTNFLLLIAYWLGPWSVILMIEHFRFRHGRYNVQAWDNPRALPLGWAALASFLIGLIGVVLGANQTEFQGPIAKAFGGMDLGFELGIIFAAVAYLILRPLELRQSGTRGALEEERVAEPVS
ncbi:MAG TPA: cytosine permease [Chloroflexota bacterium]|nr:cytosine permease [Chloroflexota bacterium]